MSERMPYINLRSAVMLLWTLVWTTFGIVVALLEPTGRLYMHLARAGWAPQVLWLGGVDLQVVGGEKLDRSRPYVVAANHASQLDIPVLFHGLGFPIRFLAKRSLFYIPLFGWSLWLAKFIPVDRGRSRRARASIDRGAERIRRGPSLMVFPEGTRTPDGAVKRFKSGAFVMAIKSGVPLLPVAIRGTFDAVPKSRLAMKPGPVQLVIGEPIRTEGVALTEKEALRRRVQRAVETMHATGEPV